MHIIYLEPKCEANTNLQKDFGQRKTCKFVSFHCGDLFFKLRISFLKKLDSFYFFRSLWRMKNYIIIFFYFLTFITDTPLQRLMMLRSRKSEVWHKRQKEVLLYCRFDFCPILDLFFFCIFHLLFYFFRLLFSYLIGVLFARY